MRHGLLLASLATLISIAPIAAQNTRPTDTVVVLPAGKYVIEARDTAKKSSVAIAGWPFVLKGNGAFTITTPDGLPFMGQMLQKSGVVSYTDAQCGEPSTFAVRRERGGFAFDVVKLSACGDSALTLMLFRPAK